MREQWMSTGGRTLPLWWTLRRQRDGHDDEFNLSALHFVIFSFQPGGALLQSLFAGFSFIFLFFFIILGALISCGAADHDKAGKIVLLVALLRDENSLITLTAPPTMSFITLVVGAGACCDLGRPLASF